MKDETPYLPDGYSVMFSVQACSWVVTVLLNLWVMVILWTILIVLFGRMKNI